MLSRSGAHDEVRDRIAREYFSLPPLNCRFCKYERPLTVDGISRVVTEHSHRQFRADVGALDSKGQVVAVVEVVNTNPPTEQILAAQSELESAFYVTLDALEDGFSGYCSPFCWTNRKDENVSPWDVPTCESCERPFHTLEFPYELMDWENPGYPVCIECAAETSHGQWRSPGELALGEPEDKIPCPNATVLDLFLSFSDADFWAMVWTKRTTDPSEPRNSEQDTSARLDQVEAAFDEGDWNCGQRLLQPIGAPQWGRPTGPPLYAWDHDNCVRTALAWRRLRNHRLSCLPPVIQVGIQSRPSIGDVVTVKTKALVIHKGFPDGRFTACGIDREKSDDPVEATMAGDYTCDLCG